MNWYTLFSFHPKEDYYFSVIDKKGVMKAKGLSSVHKPLQTSWKNTN